MSNRPEAFRTDLTLMTAQDGVCRSPIGGFCNALSFMTPLMRLRSMAFLRTIFRIVSCIVLMTSATFGQQKPITIESSTIQPSVTLGRPMLTWWDVKIQGSGLVVGKFRFAVKSEGYLFATVETDELTLNGPEQRIRVMLPAIDCAQMIDRLYVDISFEGKKYSGNLGQQILRVPFSSKTVFMSLVGESRTVRKRSPQRDKILDRLRFENLIPETTNSRGTENESEYVKTIFASIDPVDFPSEPLAYCGFDVVVLMNEEFRNLRRPQLQGLLAWIKAGGSLYIEPQGVLEPYHLEFLRNLASNNPQEIVFQLDETGRIPFDTVSPDQAAIAIESGLGNAIIRTGDADGEITVSTETWRTILGPLWRARFQSLGKANTVAIVGIGPNGQPIRETRPNLDPFGFSMALYNRAPLRPGALLDRLMPEGVRMVPLSLLAMILFSFVCLIGPGDYFGLGWLRARKFTWLTFPAATLGVTALTVWLSNSYMTAAETRRALVIRDLGPQGELVRTNRFELLFVASTHQVKTDVEKGVFTALSTSSPLDRARAGAGFAFGPNGQPIGFPGGPTGIIGDDGQVRSVTTQVEGRIPTQFSAIQDLSKWTPQINRIMSIPGTAAVPDVDWSEFDLNRSDLQVIRSHGVPPDLMARVKSRFGPQALVACFSGNDGWASDRGTGWRSTRSTNVDARRQYEIVSNINMNANDINVNTMWEAELFRWIYQASVTLSDQGAFALVKQTAPKGGGYCDDLQLLDMTNPTEWLLVVIVPEKEDFVAYRKLMRFRD